MAELHSSIIALVSLASGIASKHPTMARCQLARLRHQGISEEQIAAVIEIARHVRDESTQKSDQLFDLEAYPSETDPVSSSVIADSSGCKVATESSQSSCC